MSRIAHVLLCAAAVFWLVSMGVGCGRKTESEKGPSAGSDDPVELKWATEIAEAFLGDVIAGKWENAKQKAIKARQTPGPGSLVSTNIMHEVGGAYKPGEEFKSWTFSSRLLSPKRNEASFKGTLEGPRGKYGFTLLVQVDEPGDKWRVGDFTAVPLEKK